MKRLVSAVAVLVAISLFTIGCGGGSGDNVSKPGPGPQPDTKVGAMKQAQQDMLKNSAKASSGSVNTGGPGPSRPK